MVLLACTQARAETWHVRAAIDNDAFTGIRPPLDDLGFTNDLALAIERRVDIYRFGGSILHRMITYPNRDRWDELDIVATAAHPYTRELAGEAWLGPSFGGNFGGRAIQNWWHGTTGTGPTLEEGLANHYPENRKVGVIAGARVTYEDGNAIVHGYATAIGQLAIGQTGVTHGELAGGTRVYAHLGDVHFIAHGELAASRYHVGDLELAGHAGYGVGFQFEWRVGAAIAWSRYRVSYEYRANEGGSGEPIGVLAFDVVTD